MIRIKIKKLKNKVIKTHKLNEYLTLLNKILLLFSLNQDINSWSGQYFH
jgi:hypothetical protein